MKYFYKYISNIIIVILCCLPLTTTTVLAAEKIHALQYSGVVNSVILSVDKIKEKIQENIQIQKVNNLNQAIAEAAKSLVGVTNGWQCTEVATQALQNAGIAAGVHWPDTYVIYGHYVPLENAQPGNLIYYNNGGRGVDHIAIYIGNGLAVHGNFNGQTVITSIYTCVGAPQFIQIAL